MNGDEVGGVWLNYAHDNGPYAINVHAEEIDALRAAVGSGYGSVCFWPFGVDLTDAVKKHEQAKRTTPATTPEGASL